MTVRLGKNAGDVSRSLSIGKESEKKEHHSWEKVSVECMLHQARGTKPIKRT